jgi:C_GCAxxG_C_C family probable redox protein
MSEKTQSNCCSGGSSQPTQKTSWNINECRMMEAAVNLFTNESRCCGEAVFNAGCEAVGIKNDLIPSVALGLGGGVGLQGGTCGAVTGAALAVSVAWLDKQPIFAERKLATFYSAGRICAALKEKWGSVCCRELCGIDLSVPGGLEKLISSGVKDEKCAQYVKDAAAELARELKTIANA